MHCDTVCIQFNLNQVTEQQCSGDCVPQHVYSIYLVNRMSPFVCLYGFDYKCVNMNKHVVTIE